MSADIQIDAFPPPKMASRMEDVGVNKSKLNIWTMFALGILAGAFIGTGAIFATTIGAGSMAIKAADGAAAFSHRPALWRDPPADGPGLLPRPYRRRRGRRRAVHRQHPDRHGLRQRQGQAVGPAAQLGHRLPRQPGGLAVDRPGHVLRQAVHLWQRRGGCHCREHCRREMQPRVYSGNRAGHHVQRPGLPGGVAVLVGAVHDRQDPGDHLPHHLLCGCRF